MSAADLAYHLRSGKFADRALFVELLRRLERWRSFENCAYVSMGGYTMSDHARVSRVLGLKTLVSFDICPSTVKRAEFNRPTDAAEVRRASAKDIAEDMDGLFLEWGIRPTVGRIVWFDFTTPKRLRDDLSAFGQLVASSAPGDVLRITLNAEPRNLPLAKDSGEDLTEEDRKRRRLESILDPSDFGGDDPNEYVGLPRILARAIGRISTRAAGRRRRTVCLSSVSYSDGTQMVSVTLAITPQPSDKAEISYDPRTKANLESWPLASEEWDDIHDLQVQALTSRERDHLERKLPSTPVADILKEMGIDDLPGLPDPVAHFERYRDLVRFYPDFISLT
ncbi:O-methyltransferase [Pseudooceanicola sp. 502str34]